MVVDQLAIQGIGLGRNDQAAWIELQRLADLLELDALDCGAETLESSRALLDCRDHFRIGIVEEDGLDDVRDAFLRG